MHPTGTRLGGLALAVFVSFGIGGCMEPQTTTTTGRPRGTLNDGYTSRPLNTSDFDAALAAAEGAVMEHFEIASVDRRTGLITFRPSEYTRLGGARMRRTGRLGLNRVGDNVYASVQVEMERYATPTIRAMSRQFTADDRPGLTPIQEDAGLTPQQQEYWSVEGRDTQLENRILNQMVEALAQVQQAAPQAPATQTEAPATTVTPAPTTITPQPDAGEPPQMNQGGVLSPSPVQSPGR